MRVALRHVKSKIVSQTVKSRGLSVVVRPRSPALEVREQNLRVSPYDGHPLPLLAEAPNPCRASPLNFLQLYFPCFDWL